MESASVRADWKSSDGCGVCGERVAVTLGVWSHHLGSGASH
jgi:hypothetical protein